LKYDLIVVGGGPVGNAVARAARGCSVALVAKAPAVPVSEPGFDARVYALSPGNVAFLQSIRAWDGLPPERLTPVHAMRIHGDRAGAEIVFDAYRAGVPELAWTVEDAALQSALAQAVRGADHVERVSETIASITVAPEAASVHLAGGAALQGKLIVGADGARSVVREAAGIRARETAYGQNAVVANFACEKPHRNTAYQWFQGGPVLALLPLPGARVSMIWSLPAADADRVVSLEPRALCERLESASEGVLGAFALETPPRTYELRRVSSTRLVAPRVALVGDAAHVIHPLAGQGLNLGLQDARALAAVLAKRVGDPGDGALLRRYERARAEPILAMDLAVDGLYRLFGAPDRPFGWLRNAGLNLTGAVPVLKNLLMRHAMR
jgi:ubiquinone biosynthesis UbiH/UbiF/VisC/COQ6 family hydroxylase